MSEKLKPCPFCGGPNIFERGFRRFECPTCRAEGPPANTREGAATAWNTRHQGQDEAKAASVEGPPQPLPMPPYRFQAHEHGSGSTIATPIEPRDERIAALEAIGEFVENWFAPWGSWKTAWWEGEVSDDVQMTSENALCHVQKLIALTKAKDAS